jgi:hypothetical protein
MSAWYDDSDTPEEIAAQLQQQRENMSKEERQQLAAFLTEGIPADAAPESEQGHGTGEASGPRAPSGPNSAAILAEFQSGKRRRGSPEDMREWLTAHLNEAAGA